MSDRLAQSIVTTATPALTIHVHDAARHEAWLGEQSEQHRHWLATTGFEPKAGNVALLPGAHGKLAGAVAILGDDASLWDAAKLRGSLPPGTWTLSDPGGLLPVGEAVLGWSLAAYRFDRYTKAKDDEPRRLLVEAGDAVARGQRSAEAMALARDLVNTPANDLGPAELDEAVAAAAARFGASHRSIVGAALLEQGYPIIHAVGRASTREPRLIELLWGATDAPKLTLVGKGVCFDTGGLDIKPSSNMLLMKKDMGGAAVMLALAQAVMAGGLHVRLRLLIPAVENSISGSAFRPGDILRTRKGLTVEIGNTDAEGRLILADALTEADQEGPALLLDAATLTGAARVAVGPDLPALFTPDDALATELLAVGTEVHDPLWRLPLHKGYARYLESSVADLNNTGSKPFAGASTAALFLERFVTETKAWAHLDIFGWNDESRPGRPRGGEAIAFRALHALIERRFA